jgi:hypothetical protein
MGGGKIDVIVPVLRLLMGFGYSVKASKKSM